MIKNSLGGLWPYGTITVANDRLDYVSSNAATVLVGKRFRLTVPLCDVNGLRLGLKLLGSTRIYLTVPHGEIGIATNSFGGDAFIAHLKATILAAGGRI